VANQSQQTQQQCSNGSKMTIPGQDTKALKMAALTHALSCMKNFQEPMIGKLFK